jgi:hypothetical protein
MPPPWRRAACCAVLLLTRVDVAAVVVRAGRSARQAMLMNLQYYVLDSFMMICTSNPADMFSQDHGHAALDDRHPMST